MKTNKFLLSAFILSLSVISCTNVLDLPDEVKTNETKVMEEESVDVTFQMDANLAYNKMLDAFNNKVTRSTNQEQEYP